MGHVVIEPEELGKIRIAEAKKSGDMAGFKTVTLNVGDLLVDSTNKKQHDDLVAVIREAKPDFIITHSPDDYCSDHVELSKLVFKASFDASCPHFHPECGEATPVTPIFYSDTSRSVNFVPTEYVDITEEMELKEAMLACHESQLKWLLDHDGIDIIAVQRARAADRGSQCKAKYAEGFTQLLASQRP
jgi:LmbE family N-acetylglucosaminyl deacetylase